jgi:hypothetical protein
MVTRGLRRERSRTPDGRGQARERVGERTRGDRHVAGRVQEPDRKYAGRKDRGGGEGRGGYNAKSSRELKDDSRLHFSGQCRFVNVETERVPGRFR